MTAAPERIGTSIRVLLVDDQPIVGEAVRRMLAGAPEIEYHFLSEPGRAVEEAARLRPTVILQDLVMPDVDGLDLVVAYRAAEPTREVPLVVLSSREEATTKAEAFRRGANDYLVKLPDPIELLARIRHHSAGYVAQQERNAAFAALEESRRHLQDEIDRASDYVQSLLDAPVDAPMRVRWRFVPSATLGGDFFAYGPVDARRFWLGILDVCGHGVGSALLSVSAANLLRTITPDRLGDPAEVLGVLNAAFPMARHHHMYFTMWYGVHDRDAGTLTWSGAGHPSALLLRAGGGPAERLESTGFPVGIAPSLECANMSTRVRQGDRLYLFSDGAFEVIPVGGGEMWSYDGFAAAVEDPPDPGEPDRLERIVRAVRAVRGSDHFDDDFSLVEATFE